MSTPLRVTPYPYQEEGIAFGLRHRHILIGDEPGLGKTLQSIGIVHRADAYPALVICPASLKINWQREWEKFTDRQALILDNSTLATFPYLLTMGMHSVAVVNYESLRKYFVLDIKRKGRENFRLKDVVFSPAIKIFRSVIIDESHRVKDPTTAQTIFTKGITIGKPYTILLSGTPVVNQPADLVAQLSILERLSHFGGASAFTARYAATPEGNHLTELSERLYSSCLIRREKSAVLTQLPDKTRLDLHLDIPDRTAYDTAQNDLEAYLRDYARCTDPEIRRKMRMETLVRFMTLRSLAAQGKVTPAIEFVQNFLATGKKLILFCSLHAIVDRLREAFPTAVSVTGRDSPMAKQAAVDSFQNNPDTRLIICSIKAAGVGLTLTAASDVAFIEFPWTYADCLQCEDRAHRIGQKSAVTIYYLIASHTIDTALYAIIHRKRAIAREIMAASDDIPTSTAYFEELTHELFHPQDHP